jgi:4a-hydroxytetrahydrobiopterin dehydratase
MPKLTAAQIKQALASLPGWKRKGSSITRLYEFKDFVAAIKFVNAAAKIAEQANHHPDIDIRWNKVKLTLSTHDEGGLTEKDTALARRFNSLA